MTNHAPEGPKARYSPEQATEGYIPKPPSPEEVNRISDAQAQITDDWTGEPPAHKKPPQEP